MSSIDVPNIGDVSTHHWLKHSEQKYFHAYLVRLRGTDSVCGESPPIAELNDMDIPGDRSPCCKKCFTGIYGFDPYALPREK